MQAKKAHGGMELQSHSFLKSALRWGEWSALLMCCSVLMHTPAGAQFYKNFVAKIGYLMHDIPFGVLCFVLNQVG